MPRKKVTRDEALMMRQYCASANLRRAARTVTAHYNKALRAAGISATQLPLLAAINAQPKMSVTALAETLDLERSTVSRELIDLKRRRLVTARGGDDRRAHALALTERGQSTLVKAYRAWQAAHKQLLSEYGDVFDDILDRVRTLRRAAARLREA
jgi:DNA-binding MarR family transcriptional regulator